ncbi:conserved protein, unknown function [Hepatocystis sp. ex Piliocolobus tephrosceles]|nr:conserved protein, unknown function [Hepatocystis sp. ex Piliocolobus tephrosceles]
MRKVLHFFIFSLLISIKTVVGMNIKPYPYNGVRYYNEIGVVGNNGENKLLENNDKGNDNEVKNNNNDDDKDNERSNNMIMPNSNSNDIDGTYNSNRGVCTCNFTNKLENLPKENTKILCELKAKHGEAIKILANKEYEVNCLTNSKVYCPAKNILIMNSDIKIYSSNINYKMEIVNHNGQEIKEYYVHFSENATDILFFCNIKSKKYKVGLEGEVKVDFKKELNEEYSKSVEEGVNECDFSQGVLNISPTIGFYYKHARFVTCIHKVVKNKPFIIKLPKLDIVKESIIPSIVNCLSRYNFITYNFTSMQETEDALSVQIIFTKVSKIFNLSCSLDLSNYKVEPCSVGKEGILTFNFHVDK